MALTSAHVNTGLVLFMSIAGALAETILNAVNIKLPYSMDDLFLPNITQACIMDWTKPGTYHERRIRYILLLLQRNNIVDIQLMQDFLKTVIYDIVDIAVQQGLEFDAESKLFVAAAREVSDSLDMISSFANVIHEG